jgi:type IV pilus assembly protein PilM
MPWRRHNSGLIGIDIGARQVRAVQMSDRQGGCAVSAAGCAALPAGRERDPVTQRQAIADLLAKHPFKGKRVCVSLPAAALTFKSVRLPRMPEEELIAAGELEVRERFSDMREAVIRVLPAGLVGRTGAEQYEVIVVAARSDAVTARLKLLTELGLTVAHIEPPTQAFFRPFARFLERSADAQAAGAYVDFGTLGSRIIIAGGSEIAFLKCCPVGGESLDRAVAEKLTIPVAQAAVQREKLRTPGALDAQQAEAIREAVAPVLDQLGKEIGLCLRYYAVTFRGERPDKILGGGQEFAHAVTRERLAMATQLPVEVAPALRGIAHEGIWENAETADDAPEWTQAIGLALRGRRLVAKELQVA